MRTVISLVLAALSVFLIYLLIVNIQEPIKFQEEKAMRQDVVTNKLEKIRDCQEIYRSITGEFAHTFDTLSMVLKTDSIPTVKIEGDPDDPTSEFVKTITYSMAIDTIKAMGYNLDSLRFVPFSNGKSFNITADTITYQSINVPVVEVGTRFTDFMGKFGDARFKKFDDSYEPMKMLKFGDMSKPTIAGNW